MKGTQQLIMRQNNSAHVKAPVGRRRRNSRTSRITVERIVLLVVVLMAALLVVVNVSVMVKHTRQTQTHNTETSRDEGDGDGGGDGGGDVNGHENGNSMIETDGKIDEKLLRILRHVGIYNSSQLTEEELSLLPTWEQVVDKFGDNGPVIRGLDTCSAYRAKVPAKKRKLGVAGPFNSGTHFLHEILANNCQGLDGVKKPGKEKLTNPNVLFQVPWGKHQSPHFRLVHNTGISHTLRNDHEKDPVTGKLEHPPLPDDLLEYNEEVLPIVVVRDPYSWWQSMCRVRYAAHWYHVVPDHCPNFVPNHVEREWFNKTRKFLKKHYNGDNWKIDNVLNKANFTLDQQVIPLWVRYHSENRKHASLAHMWADWYNDYHEADFPRLLIRLEDLVFYPHETLKSICECANDNHNDDTDNHDAEDSQHYSSRVFKYVGDDNLEMTLDSAIRGKGDGVDKIHGKDRTGLLGAMKKHAGHFADDHRLTGMTTADLDFAESVLKDSGIWNDMKYKLPARRKTTTTGVSE